jgi:hypothetical protein
MDEILKTLATLSTNVSVLNWAVGILAALLIALLTVMLNISHQLGRTNGALDVLIQHVQMK